MEFNEISMVMDVKLDIHDKRPESMKFRSWTKCEVKIEAIKCVPCFLRIDLQSVPHDETEKTVQLSVSINVPGVSLNFATSRFKEHSYGLFWTHNRRDCFVYFSLETEMSCLTHMKWMKKSIKNLELYRQVFLEQRRKCRGNGLFGQESKQTGRRELSTLKDTLFTLGPLPQIPDANTSCDWSGRVSRASEIYEEIFEGSVLPSRLSRRLSRTSIASGIYEEMKPCATNINSILKEEYNCPPPLPPLPPPHRKRLNTFESNPLRILGDIPRSNTNPETDLAKRKRNQNGFENVLIDGRSKRSESVSETTACTLEDIISGGIRNQRRQPVYANEIIKEQAIPGVQRDKRNSISSPDLSKINFLDTFDEEKLADLLQLNISSDLDDHIGDDFDCDDSLVAHHYSSLSLDESSITPTSALKAAARAHALKSKSGSMESLNVSAKLPQNFNFSACNTSSINLMGASGAVPSITKLKRNKIIVEDELSGYCIMAPISSKKQDGHSATATTTSSTTSSTTSGYSTGSYSSPTSSSSSSNTQVTESKEQLNDNFSAKRNTTNAPAECFYDKLPLRKTPLPVAECERNTICQRLQTISPSNSSKTFAGYLETTPTANKNFAGNLYENLLSVKAALELEQPQSSHVCTSTPTESPADHRSAIAAHQEQENIYKTPRKSFISVDDKIPSYYPISNESLKLRQRSTSPATPTTPASLKTAEKVKSSIGLKNLVNIKIKGERKENLFISSSPQKSIEQRQKSFKSPCYQATNASKRKKSANAQKISENVYTVNLANRKSLQLSLYDEASDTKKSPYREANDSGQHQEKLQNEFLQIALLQKIDFKFDDTSKISCAASSTTASNGSNKAMIESGIAKLQQADLEYESCYQASKEATRLLNKYATLAPKQSLRTNQQHLQLNEGSNEKKTLMSQSTKVEAPVTGTDATGSSGSKKFASLPRFKKIDFSPLKLKINNVLQRNQNQDF